jgi:signal transduction histidine kinase
VLSYVRLLLAQSVRFHFWGSFAIVLLVSGVLVVRIRDRRGFADGDLHRDVMERWGAPIQQPMPSVRYVPTGTVFNALEPLPLTRQAVAVEATMNYRKRGLVYFSGFDFLFTGDYATENRFDRDVDVAFVFPISLEKNKVLLSELAFSVNGTAAPVELDKAGDKLLWTGRLKPGEKLDFKVAFQGRGLDSFTYAMDPGAAARNVSLIVAFAATALTALIVSVVFGTLISRPLRAISRAADAVAQGGSADIPEPSRFTPAEVASLRESLATMTGRLRDRARDLAEFAADATHELKGPITAIRGATELLREQWAAMDAPQRERFLANVDVDAARMERLVERLLHLARIGSAPDAVESVDVASFFRSLSERYGEAVRVDLKSPPPRTAMSADHLHSAVHNLVENGIRHRGARPVEVTVDGRDGRLVVEVRDHGPGISEANRTRIFQRFFTTCPDEGGTGLGLAIVKAVADRYRGSITWRTGPEGTSFVLVL